MESYATPRMVPRRVAKDLRYIGEAGQRAEAKLDVTARAVGRGMAWSGVLGLEAENVVQMSPYAAPAVEGLMRAWAVGATAIVTRLAMS